MESISTPVAGELWTKGRRVLTATTIGVALFFVIAVIVHARVAGTSSDDPKFKLFSNLFQLFALLWASVCALYSGTHTLKFSSSQGRGWLLLGVGVLFYALGQAFFTYYDIRDIKPFPSIADLWFSIAYPFLLSGVIFLFGAIPLSGRLRYLLDSAIAASGVGIVSWYFVIGRLWAESQETLLGKLLGVFYPLSDVALCFGAIALLSGSWTYVRLRLPYCLLAAGAILFAFTDTIWNLYILDGAYHTGSWIDPGWPVGYLLISYAALLMLWQSQSTPEVLATAPTSGEDSLVAGRLPKELRPSLWILVRLITPYCVVLAAWIIVAIFDYNTQVITHTDEFKKVTYTVVYFGHSPDRSISSSTFIFGFWFMFLVIMRQVTTLLQNQYLAQKLRLFNAGLEKTVVERTHQINSLLELTKAVNNTLQANDVLESALTLTRRALRADSVALRLCSDEGCSKNATFLEQGLEGKSELSAFVRELSLCPNMETLATTQDSVEMTLLRAPLRRHDETLGDICVLRPADKPFSDSENGMLESVGLEIVAAYQNAKAHAIALENADRDSVTGLFNHRAIHERLQTELDRAARNQRPLAVIMMDLNNFKLFNDTYGHPVGDQVLKRVATALESKCRKFDVLGRYGGDEFIAVLPETDLPLAMVVAQRWRERMELEGFNFAGDEERTIPVTLSFGIATYPSDGANRYELVSIADANLYTAKLSQKGIVATSETQRQNRQLKTESSFDVLDAMVTAVDNKDSYTRRHSEDVTDFALWIAEEMGLSQGTQRIVRLAGLLHDVGKIGVPEHILKKPGRLTNEEFEIMKQHSQFGAFIVGGVPGMEEIIPGVKSHHERYDGKGYPDGLAGESIPFLGRLLAVADACSAMTTSRPYRQALDWSQALREIEANIGTQFDPQMAHAFLRAARKRRVESNDRNYVPHLQLIEGARSGNTEGEKINRSGIS